MDKEEIYSKIPKSTCKEGCFRCCTNVVQFTPSELKACGGEYECKGVCNFLKDGKCTVYETRPFVCRIYGTSEILSCDDCTPERFLTEEETTELVHRYVTLKKKEEAEIQNQNAEKH